MARKRMIDPAFWEDEKLGTAPVECRLLFMGLISQADDEGRLRGNPALIRSLIFPYDDEITGMDVDIWLGCLAERGLIVRYDCEAERFVWIVNFEKHQTINKPAPSKLPAPPTTPLPEDYGSPTTPLPEDYGSPTGGLPPKRREVKGREEKEDGERARARDGGGDESLSEAERYVAGCVQAVRGAANIPAPEIIDHVRECLDIRGSPLSELTMRREFQKFRDHWREQRRHQPADKRWRGWRKAISNWIERIEEPRSPPALTGLDLYPELDVSTDDD